jgi:hypothetical protein
MRGGGVRSVVTTALELGGMTAVVVGVFVLAGLGACLVVAGGALLVTSWRVSS